MAGDHFRTYASRPRRENMKLVLKIATVLALLFVTMLVFNFALHLMNKPSDMAVLEGVAIVVAVLAVVLAVAYRAFKLIDEKFKQTSGLSRDRFGMFLVMFLASGSLAFN